ncbi:MAG: hypothetical protein ONB07_08525 [candidate division KSB1 bacterium]|nr:hypothetical protein [candidate division KSB1 bacterium]MDZ7393734.1 hypothetical protein [candidate division KSB1 bacterium]
MLHLQFDKAATQKKGPQPFAEVGPPPQEVIEEAMLQLIRLGHFEAAYLFTADGLPLARATGETGVSEDFLAETGLLLQQVQHTATELGGLTGLAEVLLEDQQGRKVVVRFIEAFRQPAILAVVVPPNKSFRGLTNRLVRLIASSTGS